MGSLVPTPVTAPGTDRSILFVHSSDELYGADRMLLELLNAVPRGVRAEVWLPTDLAHPKTTLCAEIERRGYAVKHVDLPILRRAYRTPMALARLVGRMLRVRRELRRSAPDILYCTTSATLLSALMVRRGRGTEIVCHIQEFWSSTDRLVLTPLARLCHRVVAISEAVAQALPTRVRARTTVVLNATPDPGPVTRETRDGPLRYVIASRWNGWKGHRTLLTAWQHAGCPGHLTILGGPPISGESVDVPALVRALGDPETVDIVGEVADPSSWVAAADVVLMPSEDPEPFGLVAIEAFARGHAVIASDAGGLAEIVTDGVDGWLFQRHDADALAGVLQTLDRAQVEAAGVHARRTFENRFTVQRYGAQWRQACGLC